MLQASWATGSDRHLTTRVERSALVPHSARQMYELVHGIENHPNCHDNIAEVLGAYGISEYDVPLGTFNIFMNGRFDEEGRYFFDPPLIEKGDSVDFLAEMDLLVAISACPDDLSTINDFTPKPLKVEIFPADTESGG